jgi:hypothetical protein
MRAGHGRRLAVASLAVAAGLLAMLNWQLVQSPVDISPVSPPSDKADAPPVGDGQPATALDGKTADQFRETVARPLFNPSRRPVERAETPGKEPKVELVELRLVGVMKAAGQPPRALLRLANEPTGKWIAEGTQIDGWKLRKVNERSVVVESGGRSQELTLSSARPAPEELPGPKQ